MPTQKPLMQKVKKDDWLIDVHWGSEWWRYRVMAEDIQQQDRGLFTVYSTTQDDLHSAAKDVVLYLHKE